jgi:hypothetical protein
MGQVRRPDIEAARMAQPSDRNAFMFKPASTSSIKLGIRTVLAGDHRRRAKTPPAPRPPDRQ